MWTILIGNDIEFLDSIKGYLNMSFSMKGLGEAAYILGIKTYRDRSRRLIGLSQSTYLDKVEKVQNGSSKESVEDIDLRVTRQKGPGYS